MLNILEKNKDISNLSNFKTKALSKYYYEINNEADIKNLEEVINYAKMNNLEYLFIWWWTNILFAFDLYDWIIIKNNLYWYVYSNETKQLNISSNEPISEISTVLKQDYWQNLFERFIWLPWTVWWAVYWNAWCFWLEISNNFLEATVINLDTFKIEKLTKNMMKFTYRSTVLKETKKYFIINISFDLSKKIEKYPLWKIDIKDFRDNRQPKWNSCWSFFKNPSKELSAWFLIEKIWLKWYNLNGAYFSNLHSNFLINDWTANYKDLLNLISLAQARVKKDFELDLLPEVNIIYN